MRECCAPYWDTPATFGAKMTADHRTVWWGVTHTQRQEELPPNDNVSSLTVCGLTTHTYTHTKHNLSISVTHPFTFFQKWTVRTVCVCVCVSLLYTAVFSDTVSRLTPSTTCARLNVGLSLNVLHCRVFRPDTDTVVCARLVDSCHLGHGSSFKTNKTVAAFP